ncbi:MAG: hypothetical protein CSA35_01320 [Dethiosulfovibrio peptidovorans]|nr:MAG: hypothetical protein CSA35_01320 [Dethiosulfovibrio peptidovorans]
MEKVMLDGMVLELDVQDNRRLFEEISANLINQGRVIQSVTVDGVNMEPEAFQALAGGSVAEFLSVAISDLIDESLSTAEEYLPRLRHGALSVADLLEKEKVEDAMALSVQVMEGVDWLLCAVSRCSVLLGEDPEEEMTSRFYEVRRALEESMSSVVEAFEEGKTFQPALVFREELPPRMDILESMVCSLRDQSQGQRQ